MSAFLGPIHHWMYHKIQLQQNLIEDVLDYGSELVLGLREDVVNRYGESEERPLEEVIDVDNIHGWLQAKVTQVEFKLAYSVTAVIKNNKENLSMLEQIFTNNGTKIASTLNLTNATEAFQLLNDSLLDGMPCDHVNTLIKESDMETIWRKNNCIHGSYWEQVGGEVGIYYELRDAFIKGLLASSPLVYEKIDKDTSRIVKT